LNTIKVEVFSSPNCTRCSKVFDLLDRIVEELSADRIEWRAVNVVEELDYAVELGVLSLPSIAIDGELVFKGHPSSATLRHDLRQRLEVPTA